MTARLRILSFVSGCVFLCLGFALKQEWTWSVGFLVAGVAGVLYLARAKKGSGWVGLAFFLGAASLGVFLGVPFWTLLLAALSGLAFWDLDAFYDRLRRMPENEAIDTLAKAHHKRLLLALGIGWVLAQASSFFQFNLSLGWAILLGLAVVLLIREGISSLNLNGQ
jgi:hypothetical protein